MSGTYCRLGGALWASNLEVLRAVHKKLKPFTRARRAARKKIYRLILKEQQAARKLCQDFSLLKEVTDNAL
ncbi:MAG: hypothetical protein DMG76_23625 [Acidobacteria bacterium]|nr:MAG: hypothetical protein DMG76_23625 [Acidobacteriota bacterium]